MYEFFDKYIGLSEGPNRLIQLDEPYIIHSEKRLGFTFPEDLYQFYTEIGCGSFCQGINNETWDRSLINRIISPGEIGDLYLDEDNILHPPEGIDQGKIPFMDLGEYTFLYFYPESRNPSSVYWPDGEKKISETFQEFFTSLYENAAFYRNRR